MVITKLTAGKPRVSLFCGTRIANQKRDINPYQRENPNIYQVNGGEILDLPQFKFFTLTIYFKNIYIIGFERVVRES